MRKVVQALVLVGVGLLFLVGVIAIVHQSQHSVGDRFMLSAVWVLAWFFVSAGMLGALKGIGTRSLAVPWKPAKYSFALAAILVVLGVIADAGH